MKLDKKDKHLLSLLYLDSRAPFTQLGREIGLSSGAVERRVAQLQQGGVISALFATVNFAKLGLKNYRLYFKFDRLDAETERGVLQLFERHPRTLWGVICEGAYDVLWRIVVKDENEVENALGLMMQQFGDRIVEKTVVTTIYQTYLSWDKAFECRRQPEVPIERRTEIAEPDAADLKILRLLYGNARETTVNLAQEVGLTPDAVQHRLKHLVADKLILGYTAWFDAKALDFNYYKLLIGLRNTTKETENEFLNWLLASESIVYLNKTIGSWDLEVDVIVRNNKELHAFTQELKTRFGGIIGRHDFITVIEERMLNPLRGEAGKPA